MEDGGPRPNAINAWLLKQLEGRDTLKWLVRHVFIYFGMVVLVGGYCAIGAYTFQFLENEAIRAKQHVDQGDAAAKCQSQVEKYSTDNRTKLMHDLYDMTEKFLISHVNDSLGNDKKFERSRLDRWLLDTKDIIRGYEDKLKGIQEEAEKCGLVKKEDEWDFKSALLFATTVVTTIGYGNRTPTSRNGRLATLLYAMMGVPIMLVCMRTLGREMSHAIDALYDRIQNRLYAWRSRGGNDDDDDARQDSLAPPGELGAEPPIGSPMAPSGLPTVAIQPPEDGGEEAAESGHHGHGGSGRQRLRVPLAMIFTISTLYNSIGAWIFAHYESWSFLEGFYFTFITISTIGFGDLVPHLLKDTDYSYGKAPIWWVELVYVVYVLLGLTVIQMTFEVTRETINSQFYQLGHTLGLVERTPEELAALERRRRRREKRAQSRQRSRALGDSQEWIRRSTEDQQVPMGRSPSMKSAEPGSSTEASSAESMPRPKRPRSARTRRSPEPT